MTGFSLSLPEDGQNIEDDAQWAGISEILGPRWSHPAVITVGLLGYQIFWSVEMSYGESYLCINENITL
jgi:solute carrier family 45, member 1/2/4